MNRRALLGVSGASLFPFTTLAQDAIVPEEWEERFAELEERISAIEERLDALMGEESPAEELVTEPTAVSGTGGAISFSGTGTTMTEVVSMNAGPYRVQAVINVTNGFGDFFTLSVAGSNDWDDQLFMEFFEGNGEYEVSTSWTATQNGEYAFQIDCMSAWEITFRPA